jgi:Domain of unknown function (DUF4440)
LGGQHGGNRMSDAIKAEIKKLEDRRFQAMIDSDFDTLDNLLGDGLVYTHSTGQSDNHAEYVAKCKKGVFKYRKIERPTENIQVYGDAAVVTGHTKMEVMVDGKPKLLGQHRERNAGTLISAPVNRNSTLAYRPARRNGSLSASRKPAR